MSDFTPIQNFTNTPPQFLTHVFNLASCGYHTENYDNAFNAVLVAQNSCASATATVEPIYVSGKAKAKLTPYPGEVACINATLTLYNTSDPSGYIVNGQCRQNIVQVWQISPAAGYTIVTGETGNLNSSLTNPLLWKNGSSSLDVIFTQAGSYTVKMYVSNQSVCGGGVDSTEQIICVRNPPLASFMLSKPAACDEFTMKLQNTSTAATCTGDVYSWNISPV